MTFLRLSRWDWLAFAAALALLLSVVGLDWYTTKQGEECARIERLQQPGGGVQAQEINRSVRSDARRCRVKAEKTALQADGLIDRVILLVLLGAVASGVAAAFLRAADRRFQPPRTPSALATGLALLGALLVLYRILQPPGFNPAAVIKAGAPIGLGCLAVLAIAARGAMMWEGERPEEDEAPAAAAPPETEAGEGPAPQVEEPPTDENSID
ncbi:MAG TPA: hypothetical protein VF545_09495 [Thermoleophilaceae bacterium]